MKILVFSDSHGKSFNIGRAINMHPDAEVVIFLGDGIGDISSIEKGRLAILTVRGNCDWEPMFSHISIMDSITLEGRKIVFTHGHHYGVKSGLGGLVALAGDTSADIVLFGHTHEPIEHYDGGVYYFNPGTIGGVYTGRSTYGIITLRDNGVLLSHGKID